MDRVPCNMKPDLTLTCKAAFVTHLFQNFSVKVYIILLQSPLKFQIIKILFGSDLYTYWRCAVTTHRCTHMCRDPSKISYRMIFNIKLSYTT